MISPKNSLFRVGLALITALFFHHLPAQNITLVSSDIDIASNGFLDDDGCPGAPPPGVCNFLNATLVGGVYGNQFANDCGYRRVEKTPQQCNTTLNVNHYYALNGSGTTDVTINWMNTHHTRHDIELGVGYFATTTSNSALVATMDITGVSPGTKVKVFFSYEASAAALGGAEMGEPDSAQVVPVLTINNKDLLKQAGYNFNLSAGAGPGALRNGSSGGFFYAIAGQPFTVGVSANQYTAITDPGEPHAIIQQGLLWKDFATSLFGGKLQLSIINPISPVTSASLEWSYFSLDIGSASEFSDPVANGTEYFDPGDAYKFLVPSPIPLGGIDGPIDDGSFLGIDMKPTAPDVPVPHFTGAPVASGLPLAAVAFDYFDLDGLDRLDFDIIVDGTIHSATATDCLRPNRHVFVSLDDALPANYLSNIQPFSDPFGAPNNSMSYGLNKEYGSLADRDEIIQRDY